jgi:hypothetical protein
MMISTTTSLPHYSGSTATLTYDLLDRFVTWNAGSQNKGLYVYDASGQRVMRRSTTGGGTTMTMYAFGMEEQRYGAQGSIRAISTTIG